MTPETLVACEQRYADANELARVERDANGISAHYLHLYAKAVDLFYDVQDAKFYLDRQAG